MKFKLIILISVIIISLNHSQAQKWAQLIPQQKIQNNKVTFFDVKKAFNDYWEPFDVVNGYYFRNGERVKAGGWKQFKRWEWLMEYRIDPSTGEAPTTYGYNEFKKKSYHLKDGEDLSDWTALGPQSSTGGYAGLGRVNCIAFREGDDHTYYIGSPSGGVWKTTDDGQNWTVLTDDNPVLGASDIIVVPGATTNTDIVYIGTGDRDGGSMWSLLGGHWNDNHSVGVLKSLDGGNSWQSTGLSFSASQKFTVNRMLLDPNDNNILYAATSNGLYKTINAGTDWTLLSNENFVDIKFKADESSVIFASNYYREVYKSSDSGNTWTKVYSGVGSGRVALGISINDPSVVYALVSDNGGLQSIQKSTNNGNTFNTVYDEKNLLGWNCDGSDEFGDGQASYDLCIAVDPNNINNVFIGGVNSWKSTDGGASWSIANHWSGGGCSGVPVVHADKHFLAFQGNSSILFECNDGGIYKSTDLGENYTDKSNGVVISQIYRIGVAQTSADHVIIGLQDNGTKALSEFWKDVIGGDGMECLIDYTNESSQYGELYHGQIIRTENSWISSTGISGSINDDGAWVTPFVIDPNNHNTLYAGYTDIWKTSNKGDNWTKIGNFNTGYTLRSLAVAPSNSSYIYTSTATRFYRTKNGGSSWEYKSGGLPVGSAYITYIAVDAHDPEHVWVTFGNYNDNSVYESTDAGDSWTDISEGLPNIPIMCIVQNRQNYNNELYVGTDLGVFAKFGDTNWTPFMNNLPNVVVTELDIYYDENNPGGNKLRAATFGRGVWETSLQLAACPTAEFEVISNTCAQTEIVFNDLSYDENSDIISWSWDFGITGISSDVSSEQNPTYVYNSPGFYDVTLRVVNEAGCPDTFEKRIEIYEVPESKFSLENNIDDTQGKVKLTNQSKLADQWIWDFGDGSTSTEDDPVHSYLEDGQYNIELITENTYGCLDTTVTVYDLMFIGLYIPTAFSPNNTQFPQIANFKAIGKNLVEFKIEVYNPIGVLVWESDKLDTNGSPSESWDGTYKGAPVPSGVYSWVASATFKDGSVWDGLSLGKNDGLIGKTKGTLTIMR